MAVGSAIEINVIWIHSLNNSRSVSFTLQRTRYLAYLEFCPFVQLTFYYKIAYVASQPYFVIHVKGACPDMSLNSAKPYAQDLHI